MKIKNKGKVYPSPSSSSSSFLASASAFSRDGDCLSILKLLPATILTLASVLSLQDREVLAYMITRSLKTTITNNNPNPNQTSLAIQDSKKKPSKSANNKTPNAHKAPLFDCDCFDCYTSYWFRWDSSPNRELIHQVIEAIEEHLSNGELFKKSSKGKRRDKAGRRVVDKSVTDVLARPEIQEQEIIDESSVTTSANGDMSVDIIPSERSADEEEVEEVKLANEAVAAAAAEAEAEDTGEMTVVLRSPPPAAGVNNHKGLARKVLPDLLGLFNSRLWHLWSPNV